MQKALYLLTLTTLLLFGCAKDTDRFIPDPFDPDPVPGQVIASVLGVVTDEQGEPVENADVWLETHYLQTNELGIFLFKDIEMSEDAYVRVEKSGYFNGSRRFYPVAGNIAQVKVQMITATTVGSFQSASGGTMNLSGGTSIAFPANAISREDGGVYSGTVNVQAAPLYTSDPDLFERMPGDLVGRNITGQLRALGSFGMIAVELRDDSGQLLQITEGEEATIEFPIADHQTGTAPATIPLWYFDESKGYWKEEGEASRVGNTYIMKVGHFSFWNCDAPFPLITLTGSVLHANGEPAVGVIVCITVPGMNITGVGYTDTEGIYTGKVPKDQELVITVKDHNGCELEEFDPVTVGPFSDDATVPPITIVSASGELVTITGNLVDCEGEGVVDGIVTVDYGANSFYFYVEEGSEFSKTFFNCGEGDVTVKGFDYANAKESLPVTMSHAAEIDFGAILVCEDLTEYITVQADGQTINYGFPNVYINGQGQMNSTAIQGVGQVDSMYLYIVIPGLEAGTYPIGGMTNSGEMFLDLGFGQWGRLEEGTATISYYGEAGDFIIGTLEGTYVEIQWPSQDEMSYPFTGQFKILRD